MVGRGRRKALVLFLLVVAAVPALGVAAARAEGDQPQPVDYSRNVAEAPTPMSGAEWAAGPQVPTGTALGTTSTQLASNVNTDCEFNGPHNETSIAINPANPLNMIGGANDYQLSLNPGGHVTES